MIPHPTARFPLTFLSILLLAALLLCASASAIVQGEDIPLGGTASGTDVVYLFMTGPNLPDQGIALAGGTPVTTGVPGSFTRVDVNTDGTWSYTWRTGSIGRILDDGTYTIYIVDEPRARSDLDDSSFATEAVTFGAPVETVTIVRTVTTVPPPPGTMQGGPLLTVPPIPAESPPAPGTPVPATTGKAGIPAVIPLAAATLTLLWVHRRLH
jgi:hypothetical protein